MDIFSNKIKILFEEKLNRFKDIFNEYKSKGYSYFSYEEIEALEKTINNWYINKYNNTLIDTDELYDNLSIKEKAFLEDNCNITTDINSISNDNLSYHLINIITLELLMNNDNNFNNVVRSQLLIYDFCDRNDRKNGSMRYIEEAKTYLNDEDIIRLNNVLDNYKNNKTLKK